MAGLVWSCGADDAPAPHGAGGAAGDGQSGDGGATGKAGRGGSAGTSASRAGGSATAGESGEPGSAGQGDQGGPAAGADAGGRGGSGGESLLPDYASGTRLRARTFSASGLAPVFIELVDSELDTPCTFGTASDGELRCLPSNVSHLVREPNLFADADCQEAVASRSAECSADARWYVEQTTDPESPCTPPEVHAFRATLLTTSELYQLDNGDCSLLGVGDATEFYRLAEESRASDFVAAERVVVPGPGPLGVRRVQATDGAFFTEALFDAAANTTCRSVARNGRWADASVAQMCVPALGFHSQGYRNRDDACNEPLTQESCSKPLYAANVAADNQTVFFEVGDEYDGAVYNGLGGQCTLVTDIPSDMSLYELGPQVDPAQFERLERERLGDGRLVREVVADALGNLLEGGGIYDSDLRERCTPELGPDGRYYCVPESTPFGAGTRYFADAGCAEPLALCDERGCPNDIAFEVDAGSGCIPGPAFDRVLALGARFDGTEVYFDDHSQPPTCEGPISAADNAGVLYRYVTGPGTLDAFVELERSVE